MKVFKWKICIAIIAFWTIFAVLFCKVQTLVVPKWINNAGTPEITKYECFYNLNRNIEILFLGPSHEYFSIYPLELYENYGYSCFNLGSPEQSILQSYYQLKEACQYQEIKYCFLDVASLFYKNSDRSEFTKNQQQKMITYMRFSLNKLSLIRNNYTTLKEQFFGLFPLFRFHGNWDSLSKESFSLSDYPGEGICFGAEYYWQSSPYLGYSTVVAPAAIYMTEQYQNNYYGPDIRNMDQQSFEDHQLFIDTEAQKYFALLVTYCDQNNIELIAIKTPSIVSWTPEKYEITSSFLQQYPDVPYLDLMFGSQCPSIDWENDTVDGGLHVNYLGGLKVSAWVGKWISENLNAMDYRATAFATLWDEDLKNYHSYKQKLLYTMTSNADKINDFFNNLIEVAQHSIIIFSARNDISTLWNDKYDNYMRSFGFEEDFYSQHQNAYIGIIENGEICFSGFADSPLIYRGTFTDTIMHSLQVTSQGYNQGDYCSILIDNKEYSHNSPGLNIVVYDTLQGKVTHTVAIDLTTPDQTFSDVP